VSAAVNAAAQFATVTICAGTYLETFAISRDITLIGAGDGTGTRDTILQGGAAGTVVFSNAQHVTLRGLRITGGLGGGSIGGGIHNTSPNLTMTGCTVAQNTAGIGGGIFNSGNADLHNCTISSNAASNGGGGICNVGTVSLTDCLLDGNGSNSNPGGGIYNTAATATVTLDNTIVRDNNASSGAGVYNERGEMRLTRGSQVTGNTAALQGGGIDNFATVVLDASSVTGNVAGTAGGGIINEPGATTTLQNGSTVSGNTAGITPNNCDGSGFSGPGCA